MFHSHAHTLPLPFPSQHEMIHAFLFLTKRDRDRDGHGPDFRAHMKRINDAAGASITVYHSFHQEVEVQRGHWWKCNVRALGDLCGSMWQAACSFLAAAKARCSWWLCFT